VLIVQRPQIHEEQLNDTRSRFVVEPLEPGFGYTLGNTLRRTLLARIPGAAVTSIQIEGVQHEFSTIDGVVEDVVDIILNIKQIVVRLEGIDEQTLYLSAKGAGEVKAGDLKVPAGVEIVNPDLVIATMSASGRLEMELNVGPGVGYRTADSNKGSGSIGLIPIDSIFSPVRKVAYSVENTQVGQMTNFDKLILDIETNGRSTLPRLFPPQARPFVSFSTCSPTWARVLVSNSERSRPSRPDRQTSSCRSRRSTCRSGPVTACAAPRSRRSANWCSAPATTS
jgi:DNA-directed RNA polymerase subunit alpha